LPIGQLTRIGGGIAERLERALAPRAVWAFAIAFALLLQAAIVIVHRPWIDEWQAVLIALLSPDVKALLANLRFEAHPPLWYLILRTAGLVMSPMAVLAVVQVAVAAATQIAIVYTTSLPRLYRLLWALGYFTLIEFGSISRSIGLGIFLTTVALLGTKRWLQWAAIILLPMVDFQFGLLSLVALALLWRDGDRSIAGFLLWGISGCLAAWSILPASDMVPALMQRSYLFDSVEAVSALSSLLVPFHFWPGTMDWPQWWPQPAGLVLGILAIWLADLQLRQDRLHRIAFHLFLWTCLLFTIFIYRFGLRHMSLAAWLFILLVVLQHRAGKMLTPGFKAWLGLTTILGLWGAVIAFIMPFDTSYRIAETIRQRGLENTLLVSWPMATAVPTTVELGREIVSMEKGCNQSFQRWNVKDLGLNAKVVGPAMNAFAQANGRFTLISSYDLAAVRPFVKLRLIKEIEAGFNGFEFYLYDVGYDRPRQNPVLPRCAPDRRDISYMLGGPTN
jgi:hypothetical protein